jgi:hypothetical protein
MKKGFTFKTMHKLHENNPSRDLFGLVGPAGRVPLQGYSMPLWGTYQRPSDEEPPAIIATLVFIPFRNPFTNS